MSVERRTDDGPARRGRRCVRLAAFAVVAGLLLVSRAAIAGDHYLRGGIGVDWSGRTVFTDVDCSSTSPAALYGCGTGDDGAPYRSVGDFGDGACGRARARLHGRNRRVSSCWSNTVRTFRSRAGPTSWRRERGRTSRRTCRPFPEWWPASWTSPAWVCRKPGPFAPFVGAGVGVVHTRIGKTTMTFPATTTTVPGGSRTGLAWMVTAGVGMAVGERAILDLAWRYTDLGKVRTGRGPGRVVWRDGSREPLPLDLAPTEARLRGHGIRLSLRCAF